MLSAIRRKTRVMGKLLGFAGVCIGFLASQAFLRLAFRLAAGRHPEPEARAQLTFDSARVLRFFSALAARLFGLQVKQFGNAPRARAGSLIVCNHLSYLDVLMISQASSCVFVTSVEIRDTPFLGALCKMAGCVFVERRSRSNLGVEVAEISLALDAGVNVVVFPESTSTNGDRILPFKKSLFVAAIDARRSVTPACLNYRKINGAPITPENRDSVFYYGDIAFTDSLRALCALKAIDVDLHFFDPIHPVRVIDHKELTLLARKPIERHFKPVSIPERALSADSGPHAGAV